MRVFDVNVLLLAHRSDQPGHRAALDFVERVGSGERPFCVPVATGSGMVCIATDPRVFHEPTPLDHVLEFLERLRGHPRHVALDERVAWSVFDRLCREYDARGSRVPDAYLAAVALVHGGTLVSADRGLARYREVALEVPPGL